MRIDVKGDVAAVLRDLGATVPELSKKATVTALNKTNDKINTRFRRDLSKRTGIKQKVLRETLRKYRATYRKPAAAVWLGLRKGVSLGKVVTGKRPNARFEPMARASLQGSTFANAFQMPGGRWVTRVGRSRLPVKSIKLDLTLHAIPAIRIAGDQVGAREFREQFERDLVRRLRQPPRARGRSTRRSRR